jgi:hypothetical protein
LLEPTLRGSVAHVVLDVVQSLERFDWDRRARVVRLERLHEVPARVHVAPNLDEVGPLEGLVEDARRVRDHEALSLGEKVVGANLSLDLADLLARARVEVHGRVLVSDVSPE